jgi:hypothetical protein
MSEPLGNYAPPGVNPLYQGRRERIRVDLLDENDRLRGTLTGVAVGGTVELNVNRVIRGGGNITLMADYQPEPWPLPTGSTTLHMEDIDWFKDRVRIWWDVEGAASWALGTFLISVPSTQHSDGWYSRPVELLDKLAVLDQDSVSGSYSLPAGTVVTTAVRDLILSAGETRMAITESDATLGSGLMWEAGTTKLRIINDLLSSINYFSLWADGTGRYQAAPYVRPDARPPSWRFEQGELALHSPEWSLEQDLYSVPNRVVLVSQGSGEEPGLVAVADNTDPDLPYSQPGRGRVITHTETGVEAASQAVLDSMARQRLLDLSGAVANLQVTHAALPLNLNDTVWFSSNGHETLAVVQAMTYTLEPGSLVAASWREVVGL